MWAHSQRFAHMKNGGVYLKEWSEGMKTIGVGFLGCGNVGGGVWRLLREMEGTLLHRDRVRFEVRKILVRDISKPRDPDIPAHLFTTDVDAVLYDTSVSLVLEFMGGVQPAADYIARALRCGKSVVTANKMAVGARWEVLQQAAETGGAALHFEAAVAAAIPVIRVLQHSMQANRIDSVIGIVNGTTNYILSRMDEEGLDYAAALAEAQGLGLAEPDPFADVEGVDAACKLSILASMAFHARVPKSWIQRRGISALEPADMRFARQLGYRVKLLALARREGQRVEAQVRPTLIPLDHPLSSVGGAMNAILLETHAAGPVMLYGKGAGDLPTASAIVSDMVQAVNTSQWQPTFFISDHAAPDLYPAEDPESVYYIRLDAAEAPETLVRIAEALAGEGVGIAAAIQNQYNGRGILHVANTEGAPLVLLTHRAKASAVQAALEVMPEKYARMKAMIPVEDLAAY